MRRSPSATRSDGKVLVRCPKRAARALTTRMSLLRKLSWHAPVAAATFAASIARADPTPQTLPTRPKPFAYGLLVGSNQGGPGQTTLRYAEEDAKKMAAVLNEVGRYGQSDMRVMTAPTAA